jgi:hypothetical protein
LRSLRSRRYSPQEEEKGEGRGGASKQQVVAEAKKLFRVASGDDLESSRDEGESDEGEDAFEQDDRIPAHLLTTKRDPSQRPLEVGVEGWVM